MGAGSEQARGEGGNLNVYGGTFESGPRPSEYYSTFESSLGAPQEVTFVKCNLPDSDGHVLCKNEEEGYYYHKDSSGNPIKDEHGNVIKIEPKRNMPILAMRSNIDGARTVKTGNVYFDKECADGDIAIPADTYCYMVVAGNSSDAAAFDIEDADFVYTYYIDASGNYVAAGTAGAKQVQIFGYTKDIEMSSERTVDGVVVPAPNYAAVKMEGGTLNVDITGDERGSADASSYGSFYSWFGTWHTSCVYIEAGEMIVSTSGKFETVNPDDLSDYIKQNGEKDKSARFGEGACILATGGTLDIKKLTSATSYNGSVISVSGGTVNIKNAGITKNAGISHANSPFNVADEGGEFPANRQYRDAALFINGGELNIENSEVTVNKILNAALAAKGGYSNYKTTIGILSRGRSGAKESKFVGKGVRVVMHGGHSYGIMATRGSVTLDKSGSIKSSVIVDSDNSCYGLYALNKGVNVAGDEAEGIAENRNRVVNVTLNGADIEVGPRINKTDANPLGTLDTSTYVGVSEPAGWDWMTGATGKMKPASIGVYLEFTNQSAQPSYESGLLDSDRAKVTINGASVHSKEMGVVVNGGILTFTGTGEINAYNATAVALRNGDIKFDGNSDYTVNCEINRQHNGAEKNSDGTDSVCYVDDDTATKAGTHRYEIFGPWQLPDGYIPWQNTADSAQQAAIKEVAPYDNVDGIRVSGGKINVKGRAFNVNFRGLYNDFGDGVYKVDNSYFDNLKIKSFAVACYNGAIQMDTANIVTTVGGGVKMDGGEDENDGITLGVSGSKDNNSVKVTTKGRVHVKDWMPASSDSLTSYNWHFFPVLSGGHAVVARSGNIEVHCGTYYAYNGNGITATNDGKTDSTINIHYGDFTGKMQHDDDEAKHSYTVTMWGDNRVYHGEMFTAYGPASHYGLQVSGKAQVTISDGTFNGKNGGAFLRGYGSGKIVRADITGGTFGDENNIAKYNESINTSDFCTLNLGNSTETDKTKLKLYCNSWPVAMNSLLSDIEESYINMYYGIYKTAARKEVDKSCLLSGPNSNTGSYGITIYNYPSNYDADMDEKWKINKPATKKVATSSHASYKDKATDDYVGNYIIRYYHSGKCSTPGFAFEMPPAE